MSAQEKQITFSNIFPVSIYSVNSSDKHKKNHKRNILAATFALAQRHMNAVEKKCK